MNKHLWKSPGLIGIILLGAACSREVAPDFTITTNDSLKISQSTQPVTPNLGFFMRLGTQSIIPGEVDVRIYKDQGKINYRIRNGPDTVGPADPWTEPDANWFLFAESITRFWAFDGKESLILTEFLELAPDRYQVKTTEIGPSELASIPPVLQPKLPTAFMVP